MRSNLLQESTNDSRKGKRMSDKIVLERIIVRNLFDRFTYDINLNNGYNVAILIAPNGCGKTTIFNLVDFIFKPTIAKFIKVSKIPVDSCTCSLSNGKEVRLEFRKQKNKKARHEIVHGGSYLPGLGLGLGRIEAEGKEMYLVVDDGKIHELNIGKKIQEVMKDLDDDELPFTNALSERYMEYLDLNESFLREMPSRFRRAFVKSAEGLSSVVEFIEKHGCKLSINYISADRLHQQSIPFGNVGSIARSRSYEERNPIQSIQEQFKNLYDKTDAEYKKRVSEARDKLPKMFLNTHNKTKLSFEDFDKSWQEYVSDMEKYYQLGLIDSAQTILENSELEKSFKDNGAFLSVYLEAFKSTLDPWNKEYERLKLFADILNRRNRVTGKTLKYGPKGLIMQIDGTSLPLECLSSGEKNDLVMFYNLIFNSERGSLVLIDEPEISLHIEWQEEYLDCLLGICDLNGLQAIVATHSPNIVNGHFELYAEKGLTDERQRD